MTGQQGGHTPRLASPSGLERIAVFLAAYANGKAHTFVNPDNGELVTATEEARALARACLQGPLALEMSTEPAPATAAKLAEVETEREVLRATLKIIERLSAPQMTELPPDAALDKVNDAARACFLVLAKTKGAGS